MPQIPTPAAKSSCLNWNCMSQLKNHCLPACALELDEEVPVKRASFSASIVTQSPVERQSIIFWLWPFWSKRRSNRFQKAAFKCSTCSVLKPFPEHTRGGMGKQPNSPLWKHRKNCDTKHTPRVYASVPNLNNYHTPSFWKDNSLLFRILLCSISNLRCIPKQAVCQVTIHHTNKKQGRLHCCNSTFLCIPIWGEQLDGLGGTIYWPWPTKTLGSWGRFELLGGKFLVTEIINFHLVFLCLCM